LRRGEGDDLQRSGRRRGLATFPRASNERVTGQRSPAAARSQERKSADHDDRTDSNGTHRHEPIVALLEAK
jgi:hypothetical protein